MLKELSIKDFALIQELRAGFAPGLNVLTGETGAGKSIIIDALTLALGGRGQEEQLRSGAREAIVEAAFDVSGREDVAELLQAEGIPQEGDEYLILRRQVLRDGKSKAYINGRLSSAATLRALAEILVEIHGQHQGHSLLTPKRHLRLLDAYAGLAQEANGFRALYQRRQALKEELEALALRERERAQRQDLLDHQRREIDAARLQEGEEEELLAERAILGNFERLHSAAETAYAGLYEEEGSILGRLSGVLGRLKEAERIDARLKGPLEACEGGLLALQEAAASLREYRDRIQFDPSRLEAVEERLHVIGRLKRKYGSSIAEVLRHRQKVAEELRGLEGSEERIQALTQELGTLEEELSRRAEALSARRREAARELEVRVLAELHELGMPHAAFQVSLQREEGIGPTGRDQVEFQISPNPGEELKPIQKIASGGELSRIMLAMKTILASVDEVPTLIFDEVDVGIGGGMAEVVGRKLFGVSSQRQVLCVTHLPQIASLADGHFQASKRSSKGRTEAALRQLAGEERVEEIARMLGGKGRSALPLQHAQEILARAERWKRGHRTPLFATRE